jgi:hypothetical protein
MGDEDRRSFGNERGRALAWWAICAQLMVGIAGVAAGCSRDTAGRENSSPPRVTTRGGANPTNTPDAASAGMQYGDGEPVVPKYTVRIFAGAPTAADVAQSLEVTRIRARAQAANGSVELATCDAVLKLPSAHEDPELEPGNERAVRDFWIIATECLAVRLIETARASNHSYLEELLRSDDPGALLPPQLGLIDFNNERPRAEAAASRCESWTEYEPKLRLTKKPSRDDYAIQGSDWSGALQLWARGDMDGDGYEDLLVRRVGGIDQGSYGGAALFLLSRTDRDKCLRVARELGRS